MSLKVIRTPESNEISLPGSLLYKEDMKKIFAILKRYGPEGAADVKVIANSKHGKCYFDEMEDFDKGDVDGIRFRDIKFEATYKESSVFVDLLSESGKITEVRKNEDIVMVGVAEAVEKIARERENHLRFFAVIVPLSIVLILLAFLAERFLVDPIVSIVQMVGLPLSRELLVDDGLLIVPGFIVLVLVMVVSMKKMRVKGNTLVNSSRGKSHIFRDRLRENWQVSAVWAAVSAVLGFLLGQLF